MNGDDCIGERMCTVGTVIAFESSVLLSVFVFCNVRLFSELAHPVF